MSPSTTHRPHRDRHPAVARIVGALLAVLLVLLPSGVALADTAAPSAPTVESSAPAESAEAPAEPSAPADPENSATWSVSTPDNEQGTDRPNFAYTADAGSQIVDGITVTNYGTQPLTLSVYAADGFLTDTGTLDLLPANEESTMLGSWVTVETPEITLQPDDVVTVPFTVNIPANATPGDYAAGVVTSLVTGVEGGVSVDRRLGSRMILRVNGDLTPSLTVTDLTVTDTSSFWPWAAGTATFAFTVTNTGNTRLALDGTASVTGPFGWFGTESGLGLTYVSTQGDGEPIALLPGSSIRVEGDGQLRPGTVNVGGVRPAFHLDATVTVNGTVISTGEQATEQTVVSASAASSFWQIPWALLILLLLLIGFIVFKIISGKRRKKATDDKVQAAVQAALAERGLHPTGPAGPHSPSTGTPGWPTSPDQR